MEKRLLNIIVCIVTILVFHGCTPEEELGVNIIPDNGYSITTNTVEDHKSLFIQEIEIKTKGIRHLMLVDRGPWSMSMGPDPFNKNEKIETLKVTLSVTFARVEAWKGQRELIVSLVVRREGTIGHKSITLVVDDKMTLKDVKLFKNASGIFTDKTTLLRADYNSKFLELYITKDSNRIWEKSKDQISDKALSK